MNPAADLGDYMSKNLSRRARHGKITFFVWQPLLLKAGLRYRKPHSLRHTYASWMLEGNEEKGIKPAEMLDVRDWMGHSSVKETEGYIHRSRASHGKASNLDAYVSL